MCLCSKNVDSRVVNELLMNKKFAVVTRLLAGYYESASVDSTTVKNMYYDFIYSLIEDSEIKNDEEVKAVMANLKMQAEPTIAADLERIRNTFMLAVKEVKEKLVSETAQAREKYHEMLSSDIFGNIKEEVHSAKKKEQKSPAEQANYLSSVVMTAMSLNEAFSAATLQEMESGMNKIMKAVLSDGEE